MKTLHCFIYILEKKIVLLTMNSNVNTVYNGTETLSFFRGPKTWALVPEAINNATSLAEFKAKIKNWEPKGCECRLCKIYIQHVGFIS